jgi:hypothetical protein
LHLVDQPEALGLKLGNGNLVHNNYNFSYSHYIGQSF